MCEAIGVNPSNILSDWKSKNYRVILTPERFEDVSIEQPPAPLKPRN